MDVACGGVIMTTINQLTILDPNGHSTTGWNPEDVRGVERARRLCEALLRRGYRAFGMERDGESRVLKAI